MIIEIITNTITGILTQLPLFFLIIWGIRVIVREMPKWIKSYHENQIKELALQRAILKC